MATPQELQNALMLKKTQGLTTEQAEQLTRVDERVDTPVSEIAVGWNPYIE